MNVNFQARIQQFEQRAKSLEGQASKLQKELEKPQTQQDLEKLTPRLGYVKTQLDQLEKDWNREIKSEVKSLSDRGVSRLQISRMLDQQKWVQSAVNTNKVVTGIIKTGVQETHQRLIQAQQTHLTSKIMLHEEAGSLNTLIDSLPPHEGEIVKHYQTDMSHAHPPHTPQMKQAILKAIIVAVMTKAEGNPLIMVNVAGKDQLFSREQGAFKVNRELGRGADAVVYHIFEGAVKVPNVTEAGKKGIEAEKRVFQHLSQRGLPQEVGASNVEEYRGVRTIDGRREGLLIKYYNRGDFKMQYHLHYLSHNILGISASELRGTTEEKVKFIDGRLANIPKDKRAILERYQIENKLSDAEVKNMAHQLITDYRFLDKAERRQMVKGLIDGLKFMLRHGVMPGDIKPENVRWEEINGVLNFVHGDFGHAYLIDETVATIKNSERFNLIKENIPGYTNCMRDCRDLFGIGLRTRGDRLNRESVSLDVAMDRMVKGGLFSMQDGKFLPNSKTISPFVQMLSDSANDKAIQPSSQIQEWEAAGLIRKKGAGYELAIRIPEEASNKMQAVFSLMLNPVQSVGSQMYTNVQDQEWLAHFARAGDSVRYQQAAEAYQKFALGVTLYEMATGYTLPRERDGAGNETGWVKPISAKDMEKVKERLKRHGLGKTKVDKEDLAGEVALMLSNQGLSPSGIITRLVSIQMVVPDADSAAIDADIQAIKNNILDREKVAEIAQKYTTEALRIRYAEVPEEQKKLNSEDLKMLLELGITDIKFNPRTKVE